MEIVQAVKKVKFNHLASAIELSETAGFVKYSQDLYVASLLVIIIVANHNQKACPVFVFVHVFSCYSIDSFLITWWPWKPVQLDGHFDWLHFDAPGSLNNCTCSCVKTKHYSFTSSGVKVQLINCTCFHGHHAMRNSSIKQFVSVIGDVKCLSYNSCMVALLY